MVVQAHGEERIMMASSVAIGVARVVLRERLQPVQSIGLVCAAAAIVLITSR